MKKPTGRFTHHFSVTFYALLSFFILSCKSQPQYLNIPTKTVDKGSTEQRALLPRRAFELLNLKLGGDGSRESVDSMAKGNDLFGFDLYLFLESQQGDKSGWKLRYSKGGGILDLAEYLDGAKAHALRLGWVPRLEGEVENPSVFLFTQSFRQSNGSVEVGLGCRSLLDLTTSFFKAVDDSGWMVDLSQPHFPERLLGRFLFGVQHEGKRKISQLTIYHSRLKSFDCSQEGPKGDKKDSHDSP